MKLKRCLVGFVILGISLAFINCSSPQKQVHPEAQWYGRMHHLSDIYLRLVPQLSNSQSFSDPDRKEAMSRNLQEMVGLSDEMVNDPKAPKADPLIAFTALSFNSDLKLAHTALLKGDAGSARFLSSQISNHCIACHSRGDRGARDYPLKWTPQLRALNPIQSLEFSLAIRQYTSALGQAQKLASNGAMIQQDLPSWFNALKKAMTVIVRVEKDPLQAEKLAALIAGNASAPMYVRKDASQWQKDIAQWKVAKAAKDEKGKVTQVQALLRSTQVRAGSGAGGGLIAQLRASSLLHEFFENPQGAYYKEAFLGAGIVSAALGEVSLSQNYFENCIKESPHSELAERCFLELETSIYENNPYNLDNIWDSTRLLQLKDLAAIRDPNHKKHWQNRWIDDADW